MTEICFAPGPTEEDVADALRGLSPRLAAHTPVLALGGRHAALGGEAVFASAPIMRLFGVVTLAALGKAIVGAALADAALAPARRLGELSATLPLDGPARLERLRFANRDRPVTFLCRKLAVTGAPALFVAAALDLAGGDPKGEPAAPPETARSAATRFLWRTDAEHRLVEIGAKFCDAVGLASAHLLGRSFAAAASRFDPEGAARLQELLQSEQSWSSFEMRWMAGSKRLVPMTIAASPSFDHQRRFLGFRGFGLIAGQPTPPEDDGRERPAAVETPARGPDTPAQTRLGESSAEIPPLDVSAFDALPVGVLLCREGAPVFANRFLLDLIACADLGGAERTGALDPVLRPSGEAAELRDPAGRSIPLRIRRETLAAKPRWQLISLQPCEPARGSEAELRHYQREARQLKAILDTATDGVAVLDADGRILSLNRSGEALFCYDKEEVSGEPFTVLIAPESRERAESYLSGLKSDAVKSLFNDGREVLGLTRQGGTIPLFMTLGQMNVDAAGVGSNSASEQDQRYCALLRDMSHWKKVEAELEGARRQAERASALKSDFLAKISHEIRTPLNAILGFAQVIMEERFGPIGNERYKDYLKDIHSSGALVMSLVNDLLDLSKIEAGKVELSFESVDANRIVSECVSIMQPQAASARVVIRLSLAPQLPHIRADERSLRQIVLNLLSNAIKFTHTGGQVIVSTALTDANLAALRIRDTGVGMSEEEIGVALEPFRQVAKSRHLRGTGLGLPLTKALVEANGAFFSIKSKVHEGTLVEVAFPPARVVAKRK